MEKEILLDASDKNKVNAHINIGSHPMLGSHNTFTYLKPKNIWHYLFVPFARCQNKTFCQQLEEGIRLFDIRVRFDNSSNIVLCHGLFEVKHYFKTYKDFITALFEDIRFYNICNSTKYNIATDNCDIIDNCIFRLVLEVSTENLVQEIYFKNFCKYFDDYIEKFNQENNTYHKLTACVRKFDWKKLYTSKNVISLNDFQHISSYPMYKQSIKVRWYEKIIPWFYAKRTNKIMKSKYNEGLYKSYDVISYDFV